MISAIHVNNKGTYFYTSNKKRICNVPEKPDCSRQFTNYEYARTMMLINNIAFKNSTQKSDKIIPEQALYCICQNNKIKQPEIVVTINTDKNIKIKPGIKSLYLFALNDQMYNQKKSGDLTFIDSKSNIYNRSMKLSCPSDNLSETLKMVFSNFIYANIDSHHIKEAKQIAPAGLFLSRKTNDFQEEYSDIPKNMSESEYEKLLAKITEKDFEDLNNDIMKNSVINIAITLNSADYKKHKENIENYMKDRGFYEYQTNSTH